MIKKKNWKHFEWKENLQDDTKLSRPKIATLEMLSETFWIFHLNQELKFSSLHKCRRLVFCKLVHKSKLSLKVLQKYFPALCLFQFTQLNRNNITYISTFLKLYMQMFVCAHSKPQQFQHFRLVLGFIQTLFVFCIISTLLAMYVYTYILLFFIINTLIKRVLNQIKLQLQQNQQPTKAIK